MDDKAEPIDVAIARIKEKHGLAGDRLESFVQSVLCYVAGLVSVADVCEEFNLPAGDFYCLIVEFGGHWRPFEQKGLSDGNG